MSTDPIEQLEAELRTAMLTDDLAALDRLIDDDLVFTGPDGGVASKADDLEMHRTSQIRMTRLDPSERRIIRRGDTAVVVV